MSRWAGLYKGHSSIVRALWLTNSITVVTQSLEQKAHCPALGVSASTLHPTSLCAYSQASLAQSTRSTHSATRACRVPSTAVQARLHTVVPGAFPLLTVTMLPAFSGQQTAQEREQEASRTFNGAVSPAPSPNPLSPETIFGEEQESFLILVLHLAVSHHHHGHQ